MILYGTPEADAFNVDGANFTIVGFAGADTIIAGSGHDFIYGNQGGDIVSGGYGSDTIIGGFGNDLIFGNQDADLIVANENDDTVYGGFGDDTVFGGKGMDVLYGNEGNDLIFGNEGNDTIVGGAGIDTVPFAGDISRYRFRTANAVLYVFDTQASGGNDALTEVEFLKFDDCTISVDSLPQATVQHPIVVLGDSMSTAYSTAFAWPDVTRDVLGADVVNLAVPGETAAQQAARFATRSDLFGHTAIIEVGVNVGHQVTSFSQADIDATIAGIDNMIANLGHDRYVVLAAPNAVQWTSDAVDDPSISNYPATQYQRIVATNAALAARYGDHFDDSRSALVADSGGTGDAPNQAWLVDNLHGNERYYQWWGLRNAAIVLRKGW